jgi:hypothetical protein
VQAAGWIDEQIVRRRQLDAQHLVPIIAGGVDDGLTTPPSNEHAGQQEQPSGCPPRAPTTSFLHARG